MNVPEAVQTAATPSGSETSGLLVRHKCACGGWSGFGEACAECKRRNFLGKPPQRKLVINRPDDAYETEADRVAEEVMKIPDQPTVRDTTSNPAAPLVQRRVNGMSATGIGAAPQIVHEVLASPGQPLDTGTRAFFEPRFGHDFSNVRVHTDA